MNWPTDYIDSIIYGDCREVLGRFPDDSIQAIVTSPPYWGLRDYSLDPVVWGGIVPGCGHRWGSEASPRRCRSVADIKDPDSKQATSTAGAYNANGGKFCVVCDAWLGALGLEPTPEMYVEHIVEIFRELRRVLRRDGTVWLNIGDSYAGGGRGGNPADSAFRKQATNKGSLVARTPVPHGLKPKDLVMIPFRVALALQADGWWVRSDIIWAKNNPMPESVTDRPTTAHEHVFLLAKSRKYYYDADAIRESWSAAGIARDERGYRKSMWGRTRLASPNDSRSIGINGGLGDYTGRNKRTVWTIPTQPYPEAHFATYPEKLVEPCILAGSSPESIVLDPFVGSGTTCAVAKRLGRHWIGIEANADYVKLAGKRVSEAVHEPLLPIFE